LIITNACCFLRLEEHLNGGLVLESAHLLSVSEAQEVLVGHVDPLREADLPAVEDDLDAAEALDRRDDDLELLLVQNSAS